MRKDLFNINKLNNLISMTQTKCCQCLDEFSPERQPRMMFSCLHNICLSCLTCFLEKETKEIKCTFCRTTEVIAGKSVESFPKNIRLIQQLKHKRNHSTTYNSSESLDQFSNDFILQPQYVQQSAREKIKIEEQLCKVHGKPLQIICVIDKTRICSHCAIFGAHKDHTFNTCQDFEKELMKKEFSATLLMERKKELELKIKAQHYTRQFHDKIYQKKSEFITEVEDKFKNLYSLLQKLQSEVYIELNDTFDRLFQTSEVSEKIFESIEVEYKKWELKCKETLENLRNSLNIDEKISIFYNKFTELQQKGEGYLSQIQKKIQEKIYYNSKSLNAIKLEHKGISTDTLKKYIFVKTLPIKKLEKTPTKTSTQRNNRSEEKNKEANWVVNTSYTSLNPEKRDNLSSRISRNFISAINKNNVISKRKSNEKLIFASPTTRKQKIEKKELNKKVILKQKTKDPELALENFLGKQGQLFDLIGYGLDDEKLLEIIEKARVKKNIKGIKLSKNNLTNQGIIKCFQYFQQIKNMNLAENNLTEDIVRAIIENKHKMPQLRVVNLWRNRVNERKAKSGVDQLKRAGVIVTL